MKEITFYYAEFVVFRCIFFFIFLCEWYESFFILRNFHKRNDYCIRCENIGQPVVTAQGKKRKFLGSISQ